MKKLKLKLRLLATAIIAIALATSCGDGKKAIAKVKPEKIEISGDLADYLQVVDNEYEVTDNWGGNLSIKVKALKPISAEELKNYDFNLSASLLGENGTPVSGTGEFKMEYASEDKLLSLLKKGSGEEVIQFKATIGEYKAEEHADKSKKFAVSSTMKHQHIASSPNNSDNSSASTDKSDNSSSSNDENVSSGGNEDWDKMLDDYEKYADDYIRLYKKAQNGDQSALSEYPDLMEKANNLSESMKKAQEGGQLTSKQMKRMFKIESKMLQGAATN